jgi:hypothetical protein
MFYHKQSTLHKPSHICLSVACFIWSHLSVSLWNTGLDISLENEHILMKFGMETSPQEYVLIFHSW